MTSISDLDIFARVARTGNMSAAGREMGLSPAVISKRVSLLEESLGARLFQRTTRHLTLTETGEGYFKRVVDILNLVEEAEDFVHRRSTLPRGQLKITAPTAFGRLHIAPHLRSFFDQFPDIQLNFLITDDTFDIIRDGVDLAIRIGELDDSSLVAKKLAANTRVICAAPKYLEDFGTPQSLRELQEHNCLAVGKQDLWRVSGPDGVHNFRPSGCMRSNSAEFSKQAIVAGLGVGLRSTWDIGPELKNGTLKIVLPQYRGSVNDAIFAVYPSREFMPSKVNAFIDFLCELYGAEPYWEKGIDLSNLARIGSSAA
ncbi:MAG: LysR family transcriptional regulator [Hyphomicrobiaceae bacterium]